MGPKWTRVVDKSACVAYSLLARQGAWRTAPLDGQGLTLAVAIPPPGVCPMASDLAVDLDRERLHRAAVLVADEVLKDLLPLRRLILARMVVGGGSRGKGTALLAQLVDAGEGDDLEAELAKAWDFAAASCTGASAPARQEAGPMCRHGGDRLRGLR